MRQGLTFEVVRDVETVLGVRSDRGAMAALTQRGPVGRAVLVRGPAEFALVFGCPLPGMLGARAARAYFANGGADLVVSRVVPEGATAAAGALPLAGVSVPGNQVSLRLREPGSFGDGARLTGVPTVSRRVEGAAAAGGARIDLSPVPLGDDGLPVLVSDGIANAWARITSTIATGYVVAPPLPFSDGARVSVTVHARAFAVRITEHDRPDVVVADIDTGDLERTLEGTPLALDAPYAGGLDVPAPGASVTLHGGSDGLEIGGLAPAALAAAETALAAAFGTAFDALDASPLPDIVLCPDLWSRVFATKGIMKLRLGAPAARELAIDLVRRASRMRDRVVLLDPPLVRGDDAEPATAPEVIAWRTSVGEALGDERAFAAAYAPWVRTLAPELRHRGDDTLAEPPSGFVAGRMARTARTRGPWISTGNVALEGAIGTAVALDGRAQEGLLDVGVNPLRVSSSGVTVQGVRAIAWPDRAVWGFLSARRLFNYLRRALAPIGNAYVFEPNAPGTWAQLRRDLEALLRDLFARGALAGSSAREAYFVKVDASLNPEDARERGILTAQIGVAPAAPLEFLVVRLVATRDASVVLEEGA